MDLVGDLTNYQDSITELDYDIVFHPMVRNHSEPEHRDLYSGLIPLHVLYHASKGPIFGLEMIEELRQHGRDLSNHQGDAGICSGFP